MSAKLLGTVDILAGLLLILARTHYGKFAIVFWILGLILIGKGLMSWL
ncbi:MAG: hypothetical protein ACLFS3_00035 [Candidatus Aenigmatarchaeota archaeon]